VDDLLRRLLRLLGRPQEARSDGRDLRVIDERLGSLEQRQREIAARLRLLERQADPRDLRHG
jgi:hypothetical protein